MQLYSALAKGSRHGTLTATSGGSNPPSAVNKKTKRGYKEALMVVSKQSIRKCIKLICNGRLCDECPIEEECLECTRGMGLGYDSTIDEFLYLFHKITKE